MYSSQLRPRRGAGGTAIIIAVITTMAGITVTATTIMPGTTVTTITAIGIVKAAPRTMRAIVGALVGLAAFFGHRSGPVAQCSSFDLPYRGTGSAALPRSNHRL